MAWIPFFGRFFQAEKKTYDELPPARVAIIGAGVGGCFAAQFLREQGGENLDIHVWAKKGSKVGGRTATFEFAGHHYETGASVIHSENKHLVDAAMEFGECVCGCVHLCIYVCTFVCSSNMHVYVCVSC